MHFNFETAQIFSDAHIDDDLTNQATDTKVMLHHCRMESPRTVVSHCNYWEPGCNKKQHENVRDYPRKDIKVLNLLGIFLAGEPGFEPGLTESESVIGSFQQILIRFIKFVNLLIVMQENPSLVALRFN